MVTTPEVLLVELMKLDPAEHPIVPQILDAVRNYPIQIQNALADSAKRSADPGFVHVGPIKALADQQAVDLQLMLDAFTAPAPEGLPVDARVRLAEHPPAVIHSEPFKIAAPAPEGETSSTFGSFTQSPIRPFDSGFIDPRETPTATPDLLAQHPTGAEVQAQVEAEHRLADDAARAAENANMGGHPDPLIPAALDQGSATGSPNPSITVHSDNGDSGGAHSGSL